MDTDIPPVTIHVVYGHGQDGDRYRSIVAACRIRFKDCIMNFSCEKTPEVTEDFEILVNGELVHSKKNGQGDVDTKDKLNDILRKIERALNV